ncbi:MAG: hypothetical protein R2729_15925 [Bryobacteraceae bacterium]
MSGELLVRAELPKWAEGPKALFISGSAIRRYFYRLDLEPPESLYRLLRVPETASLSQLRLAWRTRVLELKVQGACAGELSAAERAFNVLAHPELRACYDALRVDAEAEPMFPYGGFGSIVVEGRLGEDKEAFFADRILAYRPEMTVRKVSLLLRRCEFLGDRVVCRDPRRKLEVWLDANAVPGLDWDITWNRWKLWLRSRIEVAATFVHAGKYLFAEGEWVLREWHVALPSRLQVRVPAGLSDDVRDARTMHALLGQHAELIRRVRAECEKAPVEARRVREWFDAAGASARLEPQHVNWRPEYEPYYFDELRKRSCTWFLYRSEYLFVWANVLIAEVPAAGRAPYVFARPADLTKFLSRYPDSDRNEIRRNAGDRATELGFVGRVIRGKSSAQWLKSLLRLADEAGVCFASLD